MSKTNTERIDSIDEQIAQLAARKKQLIQQENTRLRKERNNRLYRRHGLLEKYMPDLINITDMQFEMFIKRAIDTGYGQKILAEITAETYTGGGEYTPKAEPSGA